MVWIPKSPGSQSPGSGPDRIWIISWDWISGSGIEDLDIKIPRFMDIDIEEISMSMMSKITRFRDPGVVDIDTSRVVDVSISTKWGDLGLGDLQDLGYS